MEDDFSREHHDEQHQEEHHDDNEHDSHEEEHGQEHEHENTEYDQSNSEQLKELVKTYNIWVGGLSKDTTQEDLQQIFTQFGRIHSVLIALDKNTKEPRGFGFVNFYEAESRSKALASYETLTVKGNKVQMTTSSAKTQVYVGNLPKDKTEDEIKAKIQEVTGPFASFIFKGTYAFIDYLNHFLTENALKALYQKQLWPNSAPLSIERATTQITQKDATLNTLYVKNLPPTATQPSIHTIFNRYGFINKVVPLKKNDQFIGIAYVEFEARESAEKAMEALNNTEFEGCTLSIEFARQKHKNKGPMSSRHPHPSSRRDYAPPRWDMGPPPRSRYEHMPAHYGPPPSRHHHGHHHPPPPPPPPHHSSHSYPPRYRSRSPPPPPHHRMPPPHYHNHHHGHHMPPPPPHDMYYAPPPMSPPHSHYSRKSSSSSQSRRSRSPDNMMNRKPREHRDRSRERSHRSDRDERRPSYHKHDRKQSYENHRFQPY